MKRLPTKTEIKRFKEAQAILKARLAIETKVAEWSNKMVALQRKCPHYNSWYENKGSTGSWDRDDHYWRDYECEDCGKMWTTEQSYEEKMKYPHAVEGKRGSNGEWEVYKW